MKTCTSCLTEKPESDFNKSSGRCRSCQAEAYRAWRIANRERRAEYWQMYKSGGRSPTRNLGHICAVRECGQPASKRSWCETHYKRWQIHGNPETRNQGGAPTWTLEAVLANTDHRGDCLVWRGRHTEQGYARARIEGRTRYVHRWVYEHIWGTVPEGLELDHLCRCRCCIAPDHLEAVPHHVNIARGARPKGLRRVTHCPKGHPYDGANSGFKANGRRYCRTCANAAARAYYYAHKRQ